MIEKTTRQWIDEEIEVLNRFRQIYLKEVHKLEGEFNYFSYIKDITGFKLTYDQGSEIGKRLKGKEFLEYLEFTTDVLKSLSRTH